MQAVNIVTASQLLGICRQRIQQLIYANRVKGAFKTKKGWQIPLYRKMPQIIPTKHGMKGTWRTEAPQKPKIIHINRQKIQANNRRDANEAKEPVIAVRIDSKVNYAHQASFEGKCTIVYEPEGRRKYGGAKVWIEVSPTTKVTITNWNKPPEEQILILN
jgi:hypothetical protein